ncbi:unnamed protein product, partial [Rotaria sordida]
MLILSSLSISINCIHDVVCVVGLFDFKHLFELDKFIIIVVVCHCLVFISIQYYSIKQD